MKQHPGDRRLRNVIDRGLATQLIERLALIALAGSLILVALPAILQAAANG